MKRITTFVLFILSFYAVSAETTPEKRGLDLFVKLYTIPDQDKATSPAQNAVLQYRVARIYIQRYALDRKLSMKSALEELNGMTHLFADQEFGNKNGKGDAEEFQKFQDQTQDKAGFRVLRLMMYEYLR